MKLVGTLNQRRTISPVGKLHNFLYSSEVHLEIDQNKAYTCCLTNTIKLQVFDEFDVWRAYKKHHFNELGMLLRVMQDNMILKEVTITDTLKLRIAHIMMLFKLKKESPPNTIP